MKQIVIFGLIVFLSDLQWAQNFKDYAPPVFVQMTDEYLDTFIGKDILATAQKMFGYKYTTNSN